MNISVIIPTYNRKETLSRALESVFEQTFEPFEILIIDDGSDDGTQEWIRENYPLVKYIYQDNAGVSNARNNAIRISKGEWIALLDSDDEWLPDKLKNQVRLINNNPSYKFCHTNEIWIRDGVRVNQMKKHQKYGGQIFEHCLDICRISPSSSLIKKSVFEEIGFFDETLKVCEDYDLWLRIAARYPVLFLDQPLIKKYGGHSDQLSKVLKGIEQYRIQSLEKIILSNILTKYQKNKAKDMLLYKLNIYGGGLEKRKKTKEIDKNKKKIQYWSTIS